MNPMNQWRKNKVKFAAIGLVCTGCLCFSALGSEGPTSNVWLSVTQVPSEARVSVTVPLAYGFVVKGSVDSGDTVPVSVENGNLYVPNVKVHVSVPSGSGVDAEYGLQTVSENAIPLRNYSTDVREEDLEEENPPREGLPVEVKPFIAGFDKDGGKEHYWKPVGDDPTWVSPDPVTNFKEYQMQIDGVAFSVPGQVTISYEDSSTEVKDVFWYDGKIALDAPEDVMTNGFTAAGTANVPSETYIDVSVKVGGIQNEYRQVEESLKVGAIFWQIIPGELPPAGP